MSDLQSPFAHIRPLLPLPLRELDAWPHPTAFTRQDVLEDLLTLLSALVGVSQRALETQTEGTCDVEGIQQVVRSLLHVQELLRIAHLLEAHRRTPPDA